MAYIHGYTSTGMEVKTEAIEITFHDHDHIGVTTSVVGKRSDVLIRGGLILSIPELKEKEERERELDLKRGDYYYFLFFNIYLNREIGSRHVVHGGSFHIFTSTWGTELQISIESNVGEGRGDITSDG